MFRAFAALIVFLIPGALVGRSALSPRIDDVAPQTNVTSAAPARLVLKDGERVILRNTKRLSSEDAKPGATVEFRVAKPVKVNDHIVIPEGAIATGKVIAAQPKQRRGRGGKLVIGIDEVQLVTGDTIKLRARDQRKAGGEMVSNMAAATVYTYGLAAPLLPLFLSQHGDEMVVVPYTRFEAFAEGDHTLSPEALEKAQAALASREDVGVVYVYRTAKDVKSDPGSVVTCGEALVGTFTGNNFARIELPPGQYWFHTGTTPGKVMKKSKPDSFVQLNLRGGETYYLRVSISLKAKFWNNYQFRIELVDPAAGMNEVAELWTGTEHTADAIKAEELAQFQVQLHPRQERTKDAYK